jgi:SWI/SNF-related matrix-associated actin-dependent regulator 1 of chromatin subfamily A
MKSEVLTELPKKQRIKIQVDITNRSEYNKAKTDFLSWYKNHTGITKTKKIEKMMYFIKIGQLKQLVALGKIYPAITWIDDYLSEDSNRKLVVFCHHKAVQRLLYNHYKKISARGGKSGAKRSLEVFKFQKNKRYRLFIASLKADRESITLTAANAVLFLELGWTPGEHDQAEDRINRIGQKQDSITAYYMLGKNTVDDSVWDKIQKKRGVVDTILDGKKTFSGFRKSIDITDVIKKLGDEK